MPIEDENQDVFSKEEETSEEETVEESTEEKEDEETTEETKGEEEEETPASEDDKENKSEKLIPESRLKAALTDQESRLRRELTQTPIQAPDRNTHPEEYENHMRMEFSREAMRDAHPDYEEKILHYIEMEKVNPVLGKIVIAHKNPARFAYELAKESMEIKNLKELKNSDEWKEFQAFKKGSKTTAQEQTVVTKQATIGEQLKSKPKVPNLNRTATSVVPGKEKANDQEDDLFQGHYSNA